MLIKKNNHLMLKSISDLKGYNFFIPDFQRGYRWDSRQVEALLNDIYEFNDEGKKWYCLQPIVVCKNDEGQYILLDGQQRLTTIYIILKYLQEEELFSLKYETRDKSLSFLNKISNEHNTSESEKNIDFYFMDKAYSVVEKWFTKEGKEGNQTYFKEKLIKKTQVIWYEVDASNKESQIKVFTRLNSGKIRLTNAELVKALFLTKENKDASYDAYQLLIASEWDEIEKRLNDKNFWGFFNKSDSTNYVTKIDRLLELYLGSNLKEYSKNDEFGIFNYFYENSKTENFNKEWEKIKLVFDTVEEWYNNHEYYHLIGYLVQKGIPIYKILTVWKEEKAKEIFKSVIKEMVKDTLKGIKLEDLSYEDSQPVHTVLLLFNVLLTMNKKDKTERFPFYLYSKTAWSLEHIHAQNSEDIKESNYVAWLNEHIEYFPSERYDEIINFTNLETSEEKKAVFNKLYQELYVSLYKSNDNLANDNLDVHGIKNMALLSCRHNSSLNNAIFEVKRKKIFELEEEKDSYIPIATRHVFMKRYTQKPTGFISWDKHDRDAYFEKLETTLKEYLPKENKSQNSATSE